MMGAWQIGRPDSGRPLTAEQLLAAVDEMQNALGSATSAVDDAEVLDCTVLVAGVRQRGTLVCLRIPLVDEESTG